MELFHPNKIITLNYSGSTTLLIACITPFEVSTSVIIILSSALIYFANIIAVASDPLLPIVVIL